MLLTANTLRDKQQIQPLDEIVRHPSVLPATQWSPAPALAHEGGTAAENRAAQLCNPGPLIALDA